MLIDKNKLDLVFKGFQSVYTDAYLHATVHWDKLAMTVPSVGQSETYGWVGQFPNLRKWIGDRHILGLETHGFTIENIDFESTVSIPRNAIADDRLGVFKPAFSEMGLLAKSHPEELVMELLPRGFTEPCFDGQNFFDTDHPVHDREGQVQMVSNRQDGAGPGWYLLDTERAVRPLIFQEREGYAFESMTDPGDANVFFQNRYIYGVRARVNAGYGLWQLAFGSRAPLTSENYAAARAAMMGYRADRGRILGIKPTVLVVPPALESAAMDLLNATQNASGASNIWAGTADLIVSPFLAE